MKKPRVKRTSSDLLAQVTEQLDLLVSYCTLFDAGTVAMAKPMATALRVLLHSNPNPKSNTRALLDHARLRSGRWYDSAHPGTPGNLMSSCGLIAMSVPGVEAGPNAIAHWRAVLSAPEYGIPRRLFAEWWTSPVARNPMMGLTFSRMEIVRNIADTDGGAHVDQDLDETYASLRSGEFLGRRAAAGQGGFSVVLYGNPTSDAQLQEDLLQGANLAIVRAIAHEVLLTLTRHSPALLSVPYTYVRFPEALPRPPMQR